MIRQKGELLSTLGSVIAATFKVLVDCSKTLAEMVEAGKYDWVNPDITQDHFPVKGEGQQEVEVVLFHFNQFTISDDAIAEMDKAGYRPAMIEELLALGAAHPDLQKQFPIIALGSVWQDPNGGRHVPYPLWGDAGRSLYLDRFGGGWDEGCRFVAVRK